MRSDIACVMLSCAQRHEARAQTVPQLEAVGITPRVFLDACDPVGPGGNNAVGTRAMRHAASTGLPVLLVEDDVDLAPDFSAYLDMAVEAGYSTYFYLNEQPARIRLTYGNDLTDRILKREALPRRLVRAGSYRGLFGTQCVLLPPAVAAAVVPVAERDGTAFDGCVQRTLAAGSHPVYVAVPNPVQHRHVRVARSEDTRVKRSFSFDCPRLP